MLYFVLEKYWKFQIRVAVGTLYRLSQNHLLEPRLPLDEQVDAHYYYYQTECKKYLKQTFYMHS